MYESFSYSSQCDTVQGSAVVTANTLPIEASVKVKQIYDITSQFSSAFRFLMKHCLKLAKIACEKRKGKSKDVLTNQIVDKPNS
jgi:hypothetical protein